MSSRVKTYRAVIDLVGRIRRDLVVGAANGRESWVAGIKATVGGTLEANCGGIGAPGCIATKGERVGGMLLVDNWNGLLIYKTDDSKA